MQYTDSAHLTAPPVRWYVYRLCLWGTSKCPRMSGIQAASVLTTEVFWSVVWDMFFTARATMKLLATIETRSSRPEQLWSYLPRLRHVLHGQSNYEVICHDWDMFFMARATMKLFAATETRSSWPEQLWSSLPQLRHQAVFHVHWRQRRDQENKGILWINDRSGVEEDWGKDGFVCSVDSQLKILKMAVIVPTPGLGLLRW